MPLLAWCERRGSGSSRRPPLSVAGPQRPRHRARSTRLAKATADAAVDLEAISQRVRDDGHPAEAAIFEAQAAIAHDPALASMAIDRIHGSHDDAIGAILAAAGLFAEQLRSLDDELLAARAADVMDVGDRIARRLTGASQPKVGLDRPAIVVAGDLMPSLTATLPRERLVGIVLEGSSPTAHAAILARAYGIPAVVGVRVCSLLFRLLQRASWRSMALRAMSSSTRTRRQRGVSTPGRMSRTSSTNVT